MELRDADATPERLDELPDALTEDAAFDAVTAAGAIPDDEERGTGRRGEPFRREGGAGRVGQGPGRLMASFATHLLPTEARANGR
jgi:hypothetical protein